MAMPKKSTMESAPRLPLQTMGPQKQHSRLIMFEMRSLMEHSASKAKPTRKQDHVSKLSTVKVWEKGTNPNGRVKQPIVWGKKKDDWGNSAKRGGGEKNLCSGPLQQQGESQGKASGQNQRPTTTKENRWRPESSQRPAEPLMAAPAFMDHSTWLRWKLLSNAQTTATLKPNGSPKEKGLSPQPYRARIHLRRESQTDPCKTLQRTQESSGASIGGPISEKSTRQASRYSSTKHPTLP